MTISFTFHRGLKMYNAKYNTVYRTIIRKFFVPLRFFVEKLYSLRLIHTSLVHVIRNNLT